MMREIPKAHWGPSRARRSTGDFEEIAAPWERERSLLEARLDELIGEASSPWFPEARELCRAGKRIRALVCIGAARCHAGDEAVIAAAVRAASCIEGIHLASLLHDDVIDNAVERRGLATLHRRYGRTGAILAGDMIYVKIFRHLLEHDRDGVLASVIAGATAMVEGETEQTLGAVRGFEPTVEEYLHAIRRKTAAFFATAAECGGLVAGLRGRDLEPVVRFGDEFGMMFQIVDDILDWSADPKELGKDLRADIRGGKLTLPLLLFIQDDPVAARPLIARADDGAVLTLAEEITRRGFLHRAFLAAEKHAENALAALAQWGVPTLALKRLTEFTLCRVA